MIFAAMDPILSQPNGSGIYFSMYSPNGTKTEIHDYNKLQDTFLVSFNKVGKNQIQCDQTQRWIKAVNPYKILRLKGLFP